MQQVLCSTTAQRKAVTRIDWHCSDSHSLAGAISLANKRGDPGLGTRRVLTLCQAAADLRCWSLTELFTSSENGVAKDIDKKSHHKHEDKLNKIDEIKYSPEPCKETK